MNILVAFNDNYTMPTRVMLKSLIENNHCSLDIYVIYVTLSDISKRKISELNDATTTIHFLRIDERKFESFPVMGIYSKEAYIRLFAHRYLPEDIDRVLWLDSDLIINGSLDEFYNIEFDNKLYVAYKDIKCDNQKKKISLGMPLDMTYINSGVLLMNLKEIRGTVQDEQIVKFVEEYNKKIEYVDQDVFNGLLYEHFKVIESDFTYNYIVRHITPWNKRKVYKNAMVFHYAGFKPWNAGFKYYGFHIWWKYALLTDKTYYKARFKSVFLSCIVAKSVHWAGMETERHCPRLHSFLTKHDGR